MKRRLLAGLLILAACALAGYAGFWHYRIAPFAMIETTRGQLTRLSDAVVGFNTDFRRLPRSLEELVKEGYLPAEGEICFNPMKRQSLSRKPVPYQDCEFEFEFAPNAVRVSVPKEDFVQDRFAFAKDDWRTQTITADVELYPADKAAQGD